MLNLTAIEKVLFVALLAAGLLGFWLRFRRVIRIILRSKPDADYKFQPASNRIRKFVWEVLFQGLVIQQRPLPGLAHAFVFWGFVAFALITIDHFAAGLGYEILPHETAFGRMYTGFVALFAVAVLVSIIGLAVRRFILRPLWLGNVSRESGVIALLISALMATYLIGYLYGEGGALGRLNWWAHTLALAIFLPLIPHTKHLHLVLSPATIFLERQGFSHIPPLAGDADFGLDVGKDVTRISSLQAFSCVECGRCTEHCPAFNTGKVLDPKKVILGLRGYLNQEGPAGDAPLLGTHISQKAVFQCTTCGGCEFQCPVGIQHLPIIVGLRRGAVNTGKWDDEYGNKLFLNLERNGNPLGMAAAERDKFIAKGELPLFDGSQEYCLWLGCMGAYDPKGRETILALAKLLRHLNISFGVLRQERCTGDPARRLGNDLAFSELAQYNIEAMRAANASKFLSICPHCVRTTTVDWQEFGYTANMEHHSELLARHKNELPAARRDGNIAFHDPCYLGRYRGVYDQPRDVLRAHGNLVEPERTRERSFCCGAGGGLAFLGEEEGKRVSVERAEQLIATGASIVGAACPFCSTMFRDALAAASPNPPQLLDIAQIAAASLDHSPGT